MHSARAQPPELSRRPSALAATATVAAVLALLAALATPAWAADPGRDRQWPLDVIGADAGHAVGQGEGMVIAIVDSGVDLDHEDLADRLVPGHDFVEDDADPQDEHGHGTHVAGIAAATGGNGRGVVGTAPRARIMPVRVLDENGRGSSSDVGAGIRWAVDHGADVVNLSLGEAAQGIFGSSLTDAVRYAWDNRVVVVVAAGNDFVLSSGFSDEPAVVVSATTREDRKPDYSNGVGEAQWGMAAPGGGCALLQGCAREDDVLSTYWVEGEADQYAYLQGTSMAAPHVAGAAAVLRSLGLGPRETVDRLLSSAEDVGPQGRDGTFGHGRLDLAAAVAGLDSGPATSSPAPDDPTPSPSPAPSPQPAPEDPAPAPAAAVASPGASPSPAAPSSPSPSARPGAAASPEPSSHPSSTPSASPSASPSAAPSDAPVTAADEPVPADDTDTTTDVLLRLVALALFASAVAALVVARRAGRKS